MKSGIAITTYFTDKTDPNRLSIFKRSIQSLLESYYDGLIYLVDDGSNIEDHLESVRDGRVKIIRRAHGGIAKAKNTCIKELLGSGVDVGFLADDDILYKDKNWYTHYLVAVSETGIDHLSYFLEDTPCETQEFHGHRVRKTPSVNGCFLTFTKRLINRIGYFKILPHEYGHEHSNFSIRAARLGFQEGFYDILDSGYYIELIAESVGCKSVAVDPVKFKENEQHAIMTEFKYEPFME